MQPLTRAAKFDSIGNVSVSIDIENPGLSTEQLTAIMGCLDGHLHALIVEQTPSISGLQPRTEGTTRFASTVREESDGIAVAFSMVLALNFKVPDEIARQVTGFFFASLIDHARGHLEDPDMIKLETDLSLQANNPGFQLTCLLHGKSARDALAEGFGPCSIARVLVADLAIEETRDIELLVSMVRKMPDGTRVVDPSKARQGANPTGQYL